MLSAEPRLSSGLGPSRPSPLNGRAEAKLRRALGARHPGGRGNAARTRFEQGPGTASRAGLRIASEHGADVVGIDVRDEFHVADPVR